MKAILSGNEAIARGAYESGVRVATAYPGTPSTEILENMHQYETIDCGWSPNEKVALEVGFGAALGGARTLVAMKHVGVNVAADPLMTLSYTGINGGLVLVSADDPGMHSSQNEQDNRLYARMAKVPLLEPADSQECKDFISVALEISERFDTPVILRTTTRISHSRTVVELGEEKLDVAVKPYAKNREKYVMLPGFARLRHPVVEERLAQLQAYAEETPLNRLEWGSKTLGIITSGVTYQYVKEALPEASVLKLGFSYPLPEKLVRRFAAEVEELVIVEELEPFLETQVRALGLQVKGKALFSPLGELGPGLIREKLGGKAGETRMEEAEKNLSGTRETLPARPPILCAGCSHRALFFTLKRLKLAVTGDIGCYTLGALPPLEAMDSCLCMGASIGAALGMEKAHPEAWKTTIAVIGDSTFFHSGITALMDVVYNRGKTTVLIADNRTTAMTGHQEHPGTGKTLRGGETHAVDLEELARALGVRRVCTVNPLELDRLKETLQEELTAPEPSVVIARYPCALRKEKEAPFAVVEENCTGCKSCLRPGCPAMSLQEKAAGEDAAGEDARVFIDPNLCSGCGLCFQLCRYEAISR